MDALLSGMQFKLGLVVCALVIVGVVRYINNSAKAKSELAGKVNWDHYDAVSLTFAVYFVASQIVPAVFIMLYELSKYGTLSQLSEHLSSNIAEQFMYVVLAEVSIVLAYHWLLKMRGNSLRVIGLVKPHLKDLWWTLAGFAMYFPLTIAASMAVRKFAPTIDLEQKQQIGFEAAQGSVQLGLVFICLVILPPIAEEVMCRGFLYLGLRSKLPKLAAVVITSVLFAVAHLQFGSGAPLLWAAALDTFMLSIILIYLRDRTGRLWAPIGLHMLKNALAFMALFVFMR